MKIGLIQGTSQKEKNKILEHYIKQAISPDDKLIIIKTVLLLYLMYKFH